MENETIRITLMPWVEHDEDTGKYKEGLEIRINGETRFIDFDPYSPTFKDKFERLLKELGFNGEVVVTKRIEV